MLLRTEAPVAPICRLGELGQNPSNLRLDRIAHRQLANDDRAARILWLLHAHRGAGDPLVVRGGDDGGAPRDADHGPLPGNGGDLGIIVHERCETPPPDESLRYSLDVYDERDNYVECLGRVADLSVTIAARLIYRNERHVFLW